MFSNRNCCSMRQNMYGMQPNFMNQGYVNQQPIMECEVIEPTITKCVEQDFYHEIPQE